jgi:DNA-directed RNA polymerase beta subunit
MASLYTAHEPTRKYSPIEEIDNEGFDKEDMLTYLYTLLNDPRQSITTSQEIAAFDKFANGGLKYILQSLFDIDKMIENRRDTTDMDRMLKSFRIRITFIDTFLDTPKEVDSSGKFIPRNPDDYRVNNDFYAANLIVSIKISITAYKDKTIYETKETTIKGVRISSIPIMTRSCKCNTHKATPEMLKSINEDPTDTGGYLIFNGNEYVITATENITFNKPLIFKSTLKNERVYATILSQRGGTFGNSTQLAIHLMQDYSIFLEIQTYTFVKIKIPFFLLFRLFGVCVDEEIVRMIVYDMDDHTPQSDRMLEYVIEGFKSKYAVDKKLTQLTLNSSLAIFWDLINTVANPDAYKVDDEAVRFVINDLRNKLDGSVLPHIGILPEDRVSKLLHLSMLIRDTIMVDIGMRPEDDRDHVANKRAHGAGPSLAKVTKTLINTKIVNPIQHIIITECLTKSFDAISIGDVASAVRNQIQGKELENAFIKFINASEKEGTRIKEKIRMVAQPLERKNKLNVIITMRTINASVSKVAKSTKRSDRIRYWHPSADGLICPAHTPETGEKVGTTKLLALTAIISDSDDNDTLLKNFVLKDKAVTPLLDVSIPDIGRERLARIYVNGEWIGVCDKPYDFVSRYRLLRREGQLGRFTSIEWNCVDNTIFFYMDLGRLMRPLLIVDNNLDDFNTGKAKKFCQNIRITHDHIEQMRRGELSFEDMVNKGFIEYIYPGEEILLCPSIDVLAKDKEDFTQRWTHCNIEYALYGPSALMGPLLDRNQGFRNVMVTIHSKQACGQPLCNMQTATRRSQRFHMHRVETPLIKTMMQGLLPPNSQNCMMLYAILTGFNQEDSSILNKGSVERGFLKGVYYKQESVEIEKNQSIRIPRLHETIHTKNQSYAKLGEDGIVPVGTVIEQGDIIVGKVIELAQLTEDGKRYVDKSVSYDNEEPGRIAAVITRLDGEDRFVKLTIEFDRPMYIGDKMSSRAGNKNIAGLIIPQTDMPHTEEGLRPDIVINPHSIPTRMTLAQLFETLISKLAVKKGKFIDGSIYTKMNIHEMIKEMEDNGIGIREPMVNGMTGEMFDAFLFYGPQTSYRLPKFVKEDRHAIGRHGPKNPITGQPLTGKRMQGGQKVGEMEQWVMMAQGSIASFYEEFYLDSDKKTIYICRNCNEIAIYNEHNGRYRCKQCIDRADICAIDSSKTSMHFIQQLYMSGIKLKLYPESRLFEEAE